MEHFDVAVVGLGALGSAAAYHAAKKGAKVIAFEQFELGHVRGASHDTSRIIRTSYDLPEYVALAKSAYRDWAEIEAAAKQKFVTITGGLIFLPKDGELPASQYASSLAANNLPYELLDSAEVKKRWPQFNVKENLDAVYTADTGMVHASRSVAAMQYLARSLGAELKERTQVTRVTPATARGQGVVIQTSQGRYTAGKVIIAADAWVNELLRPLDAEIPLDITQEQVTYFKPSSPATFEPKNFPVWILAGEQWYYGFPCFGEPTIKAAHDNAKVATTPAQRTIVPSQRLVEQLSTVMQDLIPDEGRQALRTVTCQYAITPGRHFVLSPLERHSEIIVALGAGHGFKFAPTIGRVAAELAIDGKTKEDISQFGVPPTAPVHSKM